MSWICSNAPRSPTGVPAAVGAKMILSGAWAGAGVFNMEQFDPDPFMADLAQWGLPWTETFQPFDDIQVGLQAPWRQEDTR